MKCSEIQFDLSLYSDGLLSKSEDAAVRGHLDVCPLCRQVESELHAMRVGLRQISRPEAPASLRTSILRAADRERRRNDDGNWRPFQTGLLDRVRLGFAPYGIGVAASLLIGFTFLALMFTRMGASDTSPFSSGDDRSLLARNSGSNNSGANIWPADYARARTEFASESPSINPQGALVAITKSFVRGGMNDDEVVVVADVFSNGAAEIAEVVEPSRDQRTMNELQKALQSDPAFAPFLPTTLENRPESVRVVLKFHSVKVSTSGKRARTR